MEFPWAKMEAPYFPIKGTGGTESWGAHEEGALMVDVVDGEAAILVAAPIAGVKREDLSVTLNHDILTIRGERKAPAGVGTGTTLAREVHWGRFSRSIILPHAVNPDRVTATFRDGILRITLPKLIRGGGVPIS